MGMIINIDKALEQRTHYNILREPLNKMLQDQQEAWEKDNPIDLLFNRNTISTFQETYTSSIGFAHAFAETSDFNVGPIFNTAEGFSATYRTRTFQGGFIITQQTLEDGQLGRAKDDASAFVKRWHGDIVEYAMTAISGGFGSKVTWGSDANGGKSYIKLESADTVDGELDGVKNPLFTKAHNIVKREDITNEEFQKGVQSNLFRADIEIGGSDPGQIAKLADFINQVITIMENYLDDNGKIAGVHGEKTIVCGNDARLTAAINNALSMDMLQGMPNVAFKRATLKSSPYLNLIEQCKNGNGFFIVDKSYNASNHGPEFTERIPFTLKVNNLTRPDGVSYDGRQRFDINVASWRGIAYCYLGTPGTYTWDANDKFTKIDVISTLVKPVTIVGDVTTTA
jgi:hypothetical protein